MTRRRPPDLGAALRHAEEALELERRRPVVELARVRAAALRVARIAWLASLAAGPRAALRRALEVQRVGLLLTIGEDTDLPAWLRREAALAARRRCHRARGVAIVTAWIRERIAAVLRVTEGPR